jgi:hypothetical protein
VRDRIWRSLTQSYLRPLPPRLGVTPRGRSRRLDRVLTDFGCEHSFARAVESVQEHYGFEIGVSAVRTATLAHAQRARAKLQAEYEQPFRVLPAVGDEHVIAEADGTKICTVQSGPRKGKRPREWKEMRLVAAQAKDSATTVYGVTFESVAETGQRWGHCTRQAGWGLNSRIHAVGDGRIGSGSRAGKCSANKAASCAISFTSANIWEPPHPPAGPPKRSRGGGRNKSGCGAESRPEGD